MQRSMAFLLALVLMLSMVQFSVAESNFTMAGLDNSSLNRDWETNLFFQRMEEKTGVHFSFTQYGEAALWSAAKVEMLAGDTALPDVLFKADLTPEETVNLYHAGKLIDLRPYLEKYAPNLWALLKANPAWEKSITLPDGAIVALPALNELPNNNIMWINTTWLDALGLSMPTTAEELTEVLRAFKTGDPNKNGSADEVPLTFMGMWDLKFLAHAFGIVTNDYNLYVDDAENVVSPLKTDSERAFLTWLHQLWTEGLIDSTGFTTIDSFRTITDSKAAITYGVVLGTTPMNLVPSSALTQYSLLMPMVYEGKQSYRSLLSDVTRGTFAITSACADPAALVSWVDYLYSEDGCRLAQAGMEGVEYEVNADGTWSWLADASTVSQTVLGEATIVEGTAAPGITSIAFQTQYDSQDTVQIFKDMQRLKEVSTFPCPLVYLSDDARTRINEIQSMLGNYVDVTMTRFVTGDYPLDDAHWNEFCAQLDALGLDEMISLWQKAITE